MKETNSERLERIKNINDLKYAVALNNPTDDGCHPDAVNIERDIDWLIESLEVHEEARNPKAIGEWHEDEGNVIWWKLPINEPPYVGTPLDSDFKEGYYTHFTRLIDPLEIYE